MYGRRSAVLHVWFYWHSAHDLRTNVDSRSPSEVNFSPLSYYNAEMLK